MTTTLICEWTTDPAGSHTGYHHGWPCPMTRLAALDAGEPDPALAVAEWRVDLPFVAGKPPLSLNDRHSWMAHSGIVNRIKAITRNAIRGAEIPELGHLHIEMHHRPATNRHRDLDNFVATLKPIIDATHQPDDRSKWVPILKGDDPRYLSWSPPILHPHIKGQPAATWLILRSSTGPEAVQEALL